ncbi:DNA polymerase [Brevibacillus laterosporus]|uniref:DNA polymerase n=1 Tax=Brevibacillus laterosporus TaxID=1465 RepID=UPI001EF87F00|nr:DNA polymerase [Brevibacillus laterosporus]
MGELADWHVEQMQEGRIPSGYLSSSTRSVRANPREDFDKWDGTATLAIDIETYSSVDLKKSGVYPYTESSDFEILLFAYAFNDDPVEVVDLTNFEFLPDRVVHALQDSSIIKTAFNASFERTCIAKHFKMQMAPEQWRCTAVHALTLGLPGTLDGVAKALKLTQQKNSAGMSLIRYFSIPCKPTKRNGQRTRNMPEHDSKKWEQFKEYCIQDVVVERDIRRRLLQYEIPENEQKLWELDQRINDGGIRVDPQLVQNAIACDVANKERQLEEAINLTGLENPNSVAQIKKWLSDAVGLEVESLNKDAVPDLLTQTDDETVKRMLQLRQEMSKTSVKKYQAMQRGLCLDGRVRGLLQFYGAGRTGRWAGRLVQVQNLPRNKLKDLDLARNLVLSSDYELLELLFGNVSDTLSQLIRTAFIPSEGCRFIVSDFSAIEARVIAWLANEQWRLDVFNTHGKIYEASAAQMFKVPIESIGKGSDLRQRGKVAELALGYQGGPNALINMGALDMGIPEEDLQPLVDAWRAANPSIKKLWYDVGNAAIKAVDEKRTVKLQYGLAISSEPGYMFIHLPSGRRLAYVNPRLEQDKKFNRLSLTYEGVEQGQWRRLKTYGGKLVENIVQAVARDCLAVAMLRLDANGFNMTMHVHDEVVIDEKCDLDTLEKVESIMGEPIEWAPGLPLRAEAFEANYYMKD